MTKINLTQFTDAGGCGCKISPKTLSEIIQTVKLKSDEKNLLAGNYYNDDAAVIKIDKNKSEQDKKKIDQQIHVVAWVLGMAIPLALWFGFAFLAII